MARITLRIPDELHDSVRALAEQQDRSLNEQLVNLLRGSVQRHLATDTPVLRSASADGAVPELRPEHVDLQAAGM
jgi:hypothetical protein